MKRINRIHKITAENDMKYRGPLSYRGLRIAGWLCLAVGQIGVLLSLAMTINKALNYSVMTTILSVVKEMAMPCFLLANFAVILKARDGFKKLFIRFGVLTGAAFAAFFILFSRYVMGVGSAFLGSRAAMLKLINENLSESNGYLAFNLFLDLLLCTLLMFFLFFEPKKVFVGKKKIIFRLFAILPVVYEGVSLALKILSSIGKIKLSIYLCPFLTTKPPMVFVVFVVLALFLKIREHKFIRHGKTQEDYAAFLETNSNSFRVSIFTAVLFAVAAVIDFILLVLISAGIASSFAEATDEVLIATALTVNKWGFGQSVMLLFLAPFVLLFSYTKVPKKPKADLVVTIGGVSSIAAVYIEGIYQIICMVATMGGSL